MVRTALFTHGAFNRLRRLRPSPLEAFRIHTEVFNEFLLTAKLELPTYLEYLAARRLRLLREVAAASGDEPAEAPTKPATPPPAKRRKREEIMKEDTS